MKRKYKVEYGAGDINRTAEITADQYNMAGKGRYAFYAYDDAYPYTSREIAVFENVYRLSLLPLSPAPAPSPLEEFKKNPPAHLPAKLVDGKGFEKTYSFVYPPPPDVKIPLIYPMVLYAKVDDIYAEPAFQVITFRFKRYETDKYGVPVSSLYEEQVERRPVWQR